MAFFDPFGGSGSGGSGGGSGAPGKDGRGISSIVFMSSTGGSIAGIAGATDTYRINYTDGTTSTYTVKNGNNGEQGPKGDKGDIGEQGPQGIQGPKGEPGENLTNIAYGTCTTAAATAEKVVTITGNSNWKLQVGSIVVVKFSYTNTAQNPTLNVNGTGAKSIWYNTALVTTSSLAAAGAANRYIKYFYDGTQFVWLGQSFDNSNTYSNASLGQVYGTCTTSEATTAKTVAWNGYVLSTGGIVTIKFTNAVPAGSTLDINGKGAKAIYHKGNAITDGIIKAGDTATFIYNSQYHLIAIDRDAATNAELTENKSNTAINKTTLGYQRKNLLKPISGTTRAGITYTVNEDGSVTLTGASTTGSTYNYFSIPITLKPGKYKVNGMPETSKTTTYRTDLRATESGGTTYGYGAKEFEVEFTETTTAYYMIRIDGTYKEELGGVTFYPMIRYADIIDDTYEPYKENIDERLTKIQNEIGDIESILSSIVEVS